MASFPGGRALLSAILVAVCMGLMAVPAALVAVSAALMPVPVSAQGTPLPVSAQSTPLPVGDPMESYLRVMQIAGLAETSSLTIRPMFVGAPLGSGEEGGHPWDGRFAVGPGAAGERGADGERGSVVEHGSAAAGVRAFLEESGVSAFANTRVPRGWNDGPVWQGRGVSTLFHSRARLTWKGLSATLDPTLIYNQNHGFALAPVQPSGLPVYAYPWRRMDWPQRFGAGDYWTFDPGQSNIALDWKAARVSFGNESMWWGPGIRNAIIMSNNAPGFLHASLSTNRPVDIGIGELEGQWIWGGLGESDYFDPTAESDRFITGLVLAYSPDWLDGLTVGGTRIFQQHVPDSGLDPSEYLLVFQGLVKTSQISEDRPEGNDERDQLLSLFARWVFPESGAEVYAEWARTDHALDMEDFLQEPEHSQGYTLGLQKVTSRSADRMFVLTGELTHLEASTTFQLRPRPTYYIHSVVTQGYTHEGQILGAWVGPGGKSQYLGFEMFDRWGSAEVFLQRQVHDNDAFWVWADANDQTFDAHHVSFDLGVNALLFRGDFELGGGAIITRQINRWFFGPHLWNLNLSLSARWRPGT